MNNVVGAIAGVAHNKVDEDCGAPQYISTGFEKAVVVVWPAALSFAVFVDKESR